MAGGKGGKAPDAPDYLALATKQGDINANAARLGTQLSRVNQVTPYGSVTYRQAGGGTTGQPQIPTQPSTPTTQALNPTGGGIYGNMMAQALAQRNQSASSSTPSGSTPLSSFSPTSVQPSDQWEQVTTLSPEQQRLFDINQSNQTNLGQTAAQRLSRIAAQGDLNFNGQPSQVTGVSPSQFKTDVNSPGTAVSSLDFSGAPALPGANDFSAERQRVEDAMYGRATADLDPQFKQREEAERTRLINSGNAQGSESWNNEMGNFGRARDSAYENARNSAILAGGNEQSRLMADALRARQQSTAETTAQGQFGNQAAQQALQAELSKLGLYNAAEGDQFAQGVTNAGLQNQGRATGIQELLTQRNQPLQEFMSLYGGAQPNVPNSPVGSAQSVSPYDLLSAANQQYQTQIDAYNARQAGSSGMLGGLLGLAGTLGSAYIGRSDERLKEGIESVGELPDGTGVYEYSFKDDPAHRREIGVMAQEVERTQPDAVLMGQDGYRRVNYSKVLARALRAAA